MDTLFYVLIAVAIIGLFAHRRLKTKREAIELREQAELQENVLKGTKVMRQSSVSTTKSKRSNSNLHVVDRTSTTVTPQPTSAPVPPSFGPESLAGTAVTSPAYNDDDQRKTSAGAYVGKGGTFDGAGSSGDWDRTPAPAPARDYSPSYDSSPSYSSNDTSSSSSSSDSSSSSSSSSND